MIFHSFLRFTKTLSHLFSFTRAWIALGMVSREALVKKWQRGILCWCTFILLLSILPFVILNSCLLATRSNSPVELIWTRSSCGMIKLRSSNGDYTERGASLGLKEAPSSHKIIFHHCSSAGRHACVTYDGRFRHGEPFHISRPDLAPWLIATILAPGRLPVFRGRLAARFIQIQWTFTGVAISKI
jgi:hypothetical protein